LPWPQEERRASLSRYSLEAACSAQQRRQADVDSAIDSRLSALLG
jgi:hypothetical protein